MTPAKGPYDRRRYKRLYMATRDCRLTLVRLRGDTREREICTLVDLSYAGLHFRAHQPLPAGEEVEFWVELRSPVYRSGFAKAVIRWVRRAGPQECDAGAEFAEGSKGTLLGPAENENTLFGRSSHSSI